MSREAMQQALNTMYEVQYAILNECPREDVVLFRDAITALEAALAEQAQPVAWIECDYCDGTGKVDKYGNPFSGNRLVNCCYPDCGCNGARLCQAENGASSCANALNVEMGAKR